eukprot:scaffold215824_cov33-Tisochrysis_lutea.AAC.1
MTWGSSGRSRAICRRARSPAEQALPRLGTQSLRSTSSCKRKASPRCPCVPLPWSRGGSGCAGVRRKRGERRVRGLRRQREGGSRAGGRKAVER